MSQDSEKQLAAEAAVSLIEDGMTVGLGTGSTALFALRKLGERVRGGLRVRGIPTSYWCRREVLAQGIPLAALDEVEQVDFCMDGADEVDPALNLIKGGGGALFREKMVAAAAKRFVVFVDRSKRVPQLGAFPLPVEVNPFGWKQAAAHIGTLGAQGTQVTQVTLRMSGYSPVVTENGGYLLDCAFGTISDPAALQTQLRAVVGVVETGLFLGMAEQVIYAEGEQVQVLRRP